MTNHSEEHHRHSIRLREYDYSQAGVYFVTICVEKKECVLGQIVDGAVSLSPLGEVVRECWLAIPQHFENVELGEFVVMPNHVHGVIQIVSRGKAFSAGVSPAENALPLV